MFLWDCKGDIFSEYPIKWKKKTKQRGIAGYTDFSIY